MNLAAVLSVRRVGVDCGHQVAEYHVAVVGKALVAGDGNQRAGCIGAPGASFTRSISAQTG